MPLLKKIALLMKTRVVDPISGTTKSKIQFHNSYASGSGTDEGTGASPGVPGVPTNDSNDEEISWKSSDDKDDDDGDNQGDDDEDDCWELYLS
nr:hypothetical protein [Tanacetum cinerariifolium]GEX62329.1 hypothetical protein [Tanacetum cinerariifolium]